MATLVKDTHKLITFLQSKGYTAQQAEGFVEAVRDFDTGALATSTDIRGLTHVIDNRTNALEKRLTKTIFTLVLGQVAVQTGLIIAIIQLLGR